jgi:hypothetical protein
MKKIHKYLSVLAISLLMTVFMANNTFAQDPADPSVPDVDGSGGVVGGGAPIGTGAIILISLAAVYGAIGFFQVYRKKDEDLTEQAPD